MWESIGVVLGLIALFITRYYNAKDDPTTQYEKRQQEFNKAVVSKDETAVNVLLDDALKRNRVQKLNTDNGRQENDIPSS